MSPRDMQRVSAENSKGSQVFKGRPRGIRRVPTGIQRARGVKGRPRDMHNAHRQFKHALRPQRLQAARAPSEARPRVCEPPAVRSMPAGGIFFSIRIGR